MASTLLALLVLVGIGAQVAQAADPRSPDYIQELQRQGY
jgi:hypothetical protein